MRKTICFAGGCFWGMEALYRRLPGVTEATAGYANGDSPDHANYGDVCTGLTGFRERCGWNTTTRPSPSPICCSPSLP